MIAKSYEPAVQRYFDLLLGARAGPSNPDFASVVSPPRWLMTFFSALRAVLWSSGLVMILWDKGFMPLVESRPVSWWVFVWLGLLLVSKSAREFTMYRYELRAKARLKRAD